MEAMAVQVGLRERKKQQTRQHIFEAARRLFERRGFDAVTVAEVAREADVSEVTVFNYFPTKEDLYYGGMQFFEEQLLEAVLNRPRGESAARAFGRRLLASTDGLRSADRVAGISKSARVAAASPSLAAREREIVERYARRLGAILAEETGTAPEDVEPLAVAWALIAAHRTVVTHVREQVRAGLRGEALVKDTRAQIRRVISRLDRGLGDYAVKA
jgi:AcrR family transcriptional regulator